MPSNHRHIKRLTAEIRKFPVPAGIRTVELVRPLRSTTITPREEHVRVHLGDTVAGKPRADILIAVSPNYPFKGPWVHSICCRGGLPGRLLLDTLRCPHCGTFEHLGGECKPNTGGSGRSCLIAPEGHWVHLPRKIHNKAMREAPAKTYCLWGRGWASVNNLFRDLLPELVKRWHDTAAEFSRASARLACDATRDQSAHHCPGASTDTKHISPAEDASATAQHSLMLQKQNATDANSVSSVTVVKQDLLVPFIRSMEAPLALAVVDAVPGKLRIPGARVGWPPEFVVKMVADAIDGRDGALSPSVADAVKAAWAMFCSENQTNKICTKDEVSVPAAKTADQHISNTDSPPWSISEEKNISTLQALGFKSGFVPPPEAGPAGHNPEVTPNTRIQVKKVTIVDQTKGSAFKRACDEEWRAVCGDDYPECCGIEPCGFVALVVATEPIPTSETAVAELSRRLSDLSYMRAKVACVDGCMKRLRT